MNIMGEEVIKQLTNILRRSTEVEFHIPSQYYSKGISERMKQSRKEIDEAVEYFKKSDNHEIKKELGLDIEEILIKVKVIK